MHALRVKIFDRKQVGGSTFDIMLKHINDVLRDTSSTYADRARAEYYRKFINEIYKEWTPASPRFVPVINTNIINHYSPEKEEPVKVVNIKDIRNKLK